MSLHPQMPEPIPEKAGAPRVIQQAISERKVALRRWCRIIVWSRAPSLWLAPATPAR